MIIIPTYPYCDLVRCPWWMKVWHHKLHGLHPPHHQTFVVCKELHGAENAGAQRAVSGCARRGRFLLWSFPSYAISVKGKISPGILCKISRALLTPPLHFLPASNFPHPPYVRREEGIFFMATHTKRVGFSPVGRRSESIYLPFFSLWAL